MFIKNRSITMLLSLDKGYCKQKDRISYIKRRTRKSIQQHKSPSLSSKENNILFFSYFKFINLFLQSHSITLSFSTGTDTDLNSSSVEKELNNKSPTKNNHQDNHQSCGERDPLKDMETESSVEVQINNQTQLFD